MWAVRLKPDGATLPVTEQNKEAGCDWMAVDGPLQRLYFATARAEKNHTKLGISESDISIYI